MEKIDSTLDRQIASALAARADVIAGYLYGSYARGKTREGSDLDVAVQVRDAADPIRVMVVLERAIEEATGIRPVEVAVLRRGNPIFALEVFNTGRLVYDSDTDARVEFEVRIMHDWFDFQPIWRAYGEALVQEIREGRFGAAEP